MLSVVEKVIFLQNVDVFSEVPTEQLAYLAAIAEELSCEADKRLYEEDDPPDSMYLVLEGRDTIPETFRVAASLPKSRR